MIVNSGHPLHLEVVVKRRDAKIRRSNSRKLTTWTIDRRRLDDEQPADDRRAAGRGPSSRQSDAERGADRERPGVTHDDARRRRVPPEKAEAPADERDGDEPEVEGGVHVVDREVAELPVPDDREHAEAERRPTPRRVRRGRR